MKVLVGCEESQEVCKAFRALGHEAYSCDLLPCSGGHPEWHIQGDVLEVIRGGWFTTQSASRVFIDKWDMGIFFPDCTFLTCSAEWAYKHPDFDRYPEVGYHQKLKSGTLFGAERRLAREKAIIFVKTLYNCEIEKVGIENPKGVLSTRWKKPTQIIQPHEYGDDASKGTCLWLKNLPSLIPTKHIPARYVDGKPRWANQTDSGQNKLPPSEDRAKLRSKTYPGIAKAMAEQWGWEHVVTNNTK